MNMDIMAHVRNGKKVLLADCIFDPAAGGFSGTGSGCRVKGDPGGKELIRKGLKPESDE